MSDNTQSPALLSPERLTQMATWAKTLQTPPSNPAAARDGQMIDELLADRDAYRQQVAAELAGLVPKMADGDEESSFDEGMKTAFDLAASRLSAAASRLGIDLSA